MPVYYGFDYKGGFKRRDYNTAPRLQLAAYMA